MRKLFEVFVRNPAALPLDKAKLLHASRDVVLQNNNIDLALQYAQKSLDYAPENVDFRLDLATISIKADEFSGALAELKKNSITKERCTHKETYTRTSSDGADIEKLETSMNWY